MLLVFQIMHPLNTILSVSESNCTTRFALDRHSLTKLFQSLSIPLVQMATGERPLFIRLSLPAGLEESLEGLAREVLRSQPKNLYKFAADHFEAKLKNRNQGM